LSIEGSAQTLVEFIKAVKSDQTTIRLQNEFYKESLDPLSTKVKEGFSQ